MSSMNRRIHRAGWILAIAFTTFAEAAPALPARKFSLEIRGPYQTRRTEVYPEQSTWTCSTESNPYGVAQGNPLAGLDWRRLQQRLERAIPDRASCRDWVKISDTRGPTPRRAEGCLTTPALAEWVEQIHRACRPLGS